MKTAHETPTHSKTEWGTTNRSRQASSSTPTDSASGRLAQAEPAPPDSVQRSELQRRALLTSISDLVFSLRKDGTILECHVPRDAAYTLSAEGLIGKRVMELLPVQIAQQTLHYLEKALRTGHRQVFTATYLVSGQSREFEARITASGPTEAVAVVREVTANKATEKEILEISNREQVRIGQDLHDGLGQHLTAITFLTKALERKLTSRSLPEAEDAAEIGRLVLQALSQTRSLARGLFPVELESSGLVPAFRELASTVSKLFTISCEADCDEALPEIDRAVATHLFRLAQEAVNNSVKHGKAKKIAIGLKAVENSLVLVIRDNGTGFAQQSVPSKGLGLRIMSYRAHNRSSSPALMRRWDTSRPNSLPSWIKLLPD